MRKGITILLFGMLALGTPPAANRLWGQAEKKDAMPDPAVKVGDMAPFLDRKSTRLNSSHLGISYADFCFKKKNYIFAFTGSLTKQMQHYQQYLVTRRVTQSK